MKSASVITATLLLTASVGAVVGCTNARLPSETNHDREPAHYPLYVNERLGVAIRVPETATISMPTDHRVRIRLLGPSNEPATEITDGFTFTIHRDRRVHSERGLRAYAASIAANRNAVRGFRSKTVAGYNAYRFRFETALGPSATSLVFLPSDEAGYVITYMIADPHGRGYRAVISAMLDSIEFTNVDSEQGGAVSTTTVPIALLDYPAVGGRFTRASHGAPRGCDRVVFIEREVGATQQTLDAALNELFSLEQRRVAGWQNFIARINDTLSFDHASVDDGVAAVYLTGRLTGLGGVCDNPRAAIQITATARHLKSVRTVRLYLNGQPTDLVPNARGGT